MDTVSYLHPAVTVHLGKMSVLKIYEDKYIHAYNYHSVASNRVFSFSGVYKIQANGTMNKQ